MVEDLTSVPETRDIPVLIFENHFKKIPDSFLLSVRDPKVSPSLIIGTLSKTGRVCRVERIFFCPTVSTRHGFQSTAVLTRS